MLRNLLSRVVEIVTSEMPAVEKKNCRGKRSAPYHRGLHLESLENRELLSVTLGDFEAVKAIYGDLGLTNFADYNCIEVGGATTNGIDEFAFSVAGIKDAIAKAGTTTKQDIIVVRTTASQNTITYASTADELSININAASSGSVAIVSLGTSPLTIDAAQKSRGMSVESSTVALAGLTITGGETTGDGGGIYCYYSTLTVTNCTISGNSAASYSGGGVYNGGTLKITNSTVSGNAANFGGGIWNSSGTLTVTNCTISGNTADSFGGGIHNSSSTLTINNTIVAKNNTDIYGSSSGTITGSNNIIGNGANLTFGNGSYGNIVGIDPKIGELTKLANGQMIHPLLSGSPAINAGYNYLVPSGVTTDQAGNARIADYIVDIGAAEGVTETPRSAVTYIVTSLADTIADDGILTFIEAFMAANYNIAVGDAVAGSFTEKDCIVFSTGLTGTVKLTGSALTILGSVDIDAANANIIFDGDNKSGVFFVSRVNVSLNNVTITGGNAYKYGGGIYSTGTLTVMNCTISGNSTASSGGGIYNGGALTVTNSTINGNSAASGGGVYNWGTLTITNSTISGNSAASSGGGVYNYDRTLTVRNCTITGNTATSGGGIYNAYGALTVNNTIVARNSTDVYGGSSGTITGSNNIIGNGANQTLVHGNNGNIVGSMVSPINPQFVKIPAIIDITTTGANYNASNWDLRLSDTSPAINKGNNSLASMIQYDLDGNPRIINGTVDIGAYEYIVPHTLSGLTVSSNSPVVGTAITVTPTPAYATVTYQWYRCTSTTGEWELIAGATNKSYIPINADNGQFLKVVATGNGKTSGEESVILTNAVPTPLAMPTDLSLTATSSETISVAWSVVENASGYKIQYSTTSDFSSGNQTQTATGNSTTLTGLSANVTYYVRIMATGTGNYSDSGYSTSQNALTYPGAPSNLRSTSQTTTSITVAWDAPTGGAASYKLEWSADGTSNWTLIGTLTGTNYTHSSLTANTTYHYRVTAVNATGDSVASDTLSATTQKTTLGTPTLNAPTSVTSSGMTISWDTITGASGYIVEYSTGLQTWTVDATDASAILTNLSANTAYSVRVMATGTGDYADSVYSAAQSATTQKITLTAPTLATVYTTSSSAISVTWEAVDNATGYIVEYSTGLQTWTVDATDESAILTNLLANTTYSVRVMATGMGDYTDSVYSAAQSATTQKITLTTPTLTTVSATSSSAISVTWEAVNNASSYFVQYATDENFTENVGTATVTGNSTTLTGLNANTTYYVCVMAKCNGATYTDSGYSTAISATTLSLSELAIPANLRVTAQGKTTLTLSWNKVTDATGYVLERKNGDTWEVVDTVTNTQYVHTGLTAGESYEYRVKATGAGGALSAYSGGIIATTLAATVPADVPAITQATQNLDTGAATLKWESLGAGYTYYVVRDNMILTPSGQTTNTFTDNINSDGSVYRILAKRSGGFSEVPSIVLSRSANQPEIISHSISGNQVTLNWNAISGASKIVIINSGNAIVANLSGSAIGWTGTFPSGNYETYAIVALVGGSPMYSSAYVVTTPTLAAGLMASAAAASASLPESSMTPLSSSVTMDAVFALDAEEEVSLSGRLGDSSGLSDDWFISGRRSATVMPKPRAADEFWKLYGSDSDKPLATVLRR